MITRLLLPLLLGTVASAAADLGNASSERGERLFETHQCIRCHSVNGKGGAIAPDLGRRIGRGMTPARLTAALWNHAPAMWSEMERQKIEPRPMSQADAADLFAFFYSARFFEKPGDAGRGKRAFSRGHCADCHGITQPKGTAPAVTAWRSLGSPVALAEAMWNHAKGMRSKFTQRGYAWPHLSGQDLTDIYVYLGNHPSLPRRQSSFQMAAIGGGPDLLNTKGCAGCHTGALALTSRLQGKTITEVAAAMWNHAPKMADAAGRFNAGEMEGLLSHIWARQFFEAWGNAGRGERVFLDKSCAGCHQNGPGPRLVAPFTFVSMTSALWSHGPAMLQQINSKGAAWPRFTEREISDLVMHLHSRR